MEATTRSRSRRNRIRSLTPSATDTHLSVTRFEPRPESTRERWVHVRLIESPHLSHRTELTAITTGIEGLSHRLPHLQRERTRPQAARSNAVQGCHEDPSDADPRQYHPEPHPDRHQ